MSVIIRLQNLPWSANALDIREFFKGLQIPEGGVHIVGGEQGDAFIAFGTDEDARLAMQKTGSTLKGIQVTLLLSSRSEMQKVIESARQQAMALQGYMAPPAPASIPAQKPQQTMPPQQQQQPPPSVGQMHPYQPQQPASHMPYPSAMHQMSPDARHSQLPPHMQPQSQGHLMQTPPMSNASSNNNQMHSGHGQMHGHGGVDSHGQNHLQHSSVNQADKKDDKKDSSSSKRDSKGRDGRRRRSKSRSRSRSRSRDRDRRRRHRSRSRSRSRDRSGRSRRRSRSRERDRGRDRTRDRNDRDKDRAARPGRDRSERDSQDTMEAAPVQESHPKEGNNGGIPGLGDIPSASMRGPLPSSLSEPPKNSPIHTPSPASTPAYNTAAPFSANNPYSAAPPFGQTFNFMNIPPPNMVGSTKFPEVPEMDQDEESQMSREAAGSDYLADQMMSHKSEQMYGSRSDKMQSGGPMDGMAAHRPESTGLLGDAPGELPHGAFAGRGFAMSRGSDAFGYDRGPGTRPSSADGRNSDFDSRNRDGRMGGGREFRDSRGFREMDMRDGRGPRDKDSRDDREMREDSDRRGWGPRGDMRGERGNRWDTQEDHDAGWGRGRDGWNGRGDRDNWSGKGGRDSRDSWNEHDGWAKQEDGWEDHEGYYPEEDEEENYDDMYESMGRGGYRGGRGGMRGWERGRGRGRGFGPRYGEYREGYQEGYPDDGYGGHRGGYRGGYRGRGGGPGPYREGGEGGGGGGDKPKYTCSVEIRNIPQGTSYRAIRELFHGIYVPNNSIKLLGDDQGNRLNIALLKFSQPRDALKAVRCSGKYLYDNQVEIKFLTDAKYEAAVDVNQMQGKLHSGGKSGSGGYDEKLQDSSCICVSGLPNGSTENDVAHVFSRCKIIDIVLERDRNSRLPTGRCFVRVQSSDEAQRAVDALSGNAKIGSSQLEIELCSLESMMAAKGIDSSENSSNQSKSLADQKPINSQQGKGMETHNGDEGPGKHTPLGADLLTDSVVMKGVPKDTSEASIRDFFSDEGLVPEEVHFCEPLEDGVVYVMFPLIQDARRAVGKSQQQLGKVKVQVDLIAKPVVMTALGKPFDPLELIKKGQDSLSKGDLNPDKSSSDGGAETSQDSLKIDSENQSNDSQKDETEDMYEGGNLSKAPLIREPLLQHGQSMQDKDSRRDDKPPRFDPYSGMGGMPRGPYRGGLMGHYPGAPRGFRPRGDMRGGMHRMPGGMRDPGGFNRMRGPYPMMRDSSDPSTGKDAMGTAIPPEKFGKPGCVVALGNVSYRATTDDILDFFHEFTDLRPQNVIRRYNEFNQPTADARVSLTSAQDAQRALKTLHRQFMCNRQIFLSLVQE